MRCPYCVTEIDDASLVCAHCRRDLFLFRPLLEKIASMEGQLAQLSSVKTLEERIAKLESGLLADATSARGDSTENPTASTNAAQSPLWRTAVMAWLTPFVLLVLSHWLIVMVYDLKTLVLRVVSLLIPLPFGFALARAASARGRRYALLGSGLALSMSFAAVFGMSWTTHFVDQVPVLPANARDWREFVEYLLSIAFSFVTAMLLCGLWMRHLPSQETITVSDLAMQAARIVTGGQTAAKKVQDTAEKITSVTGAIAATGTSVAAAYTGLRAVMGNG